MTERLRSELEALLSKDLEAGTLVLAANRKICRTHYANALGASKKVIQAKVADIYGQYEAKYRQFSLEYASRIISDAIQSGTLPVISSRLSRKWLASQLGISTNSLLRNAGMQTLIREFDKQITSTGYLSRDRSALLQRLRAALQEECPLAKNGRAVGRTALARKLGIEPALLKQPPFRQLVQEKNAKLAKGIGLRLGDVLIRKRVAAFGQLLEFWPPDFVQQLGQAFRKFAFGYSNDGYGYDKVLRRLLLWIQKTDTPECLSFIHSVRRNELPSSAIWDDILYAYCQSIGSSKLAAGSVQTEIGNLNALLRNLGLAGVLPPFERKLRAPKNRSRKAATHLRSVAEVSRGTSIGKQAKDYAQKALLDARSKFGTQYDAEGARNFLRSIEEEFAIRQEPMPKNLPTAVLSVLDRRLSLIKTKAIEVIRASQAMLSAGRELLTHSTLPEDFMSQLAATEAMSWSRIELLQAYFPAPNTEEKERRTKANILMLANRHFRGILPSLDLEFSEYRGLNRYFFSKIYLSVGVAKFFKTY